MNNILDLSSSLDFNNSGVIKGEIEIDNVFELENNIEILVQDKIIEPTREIQTVAADEDYDQLGTVTVNPIPDEYIIPDGTLDVDANGDVDVTMFRMARVGVYTSPTLQDKSIEITENGTVTVTPDADYDGLSSVEITTNAVEDLTEELTDYNAKLTAQKTSIQDIVTALSSKAMGNGIDGSKSKPVTNIFIQEEEPETKDGIWLQINNKFTHVRFHKEKEVEIAANLESTNDQSRAFAASAMVGDNIYIFGGKVNSTSGNFLTTAYKYNVIDKTYTPIADYPIAVGVHHATAIGDYVYIFGGRDNSFTYLVDSYRYDTINDTYTKLNNLPDARGYAGVVSVNSDIYIIGGQSDTCTNMYKYNTLTDTYESIDLGIKFENQTSMVLGSNIYMVKMGSKNNLGNFVYTIHKYDTLTKTFERHGTFQFPYGICNAIVDDMFIYYIGYSKGDLNLVRYNILTKEYKIISHYGIDHEYNYSQLHYKNGLLFVLGGHVDGVVNKDIYSITVRDNEETYENDIVIIKQFDGIDLYNINFTYDDFINASVDFYDVVYFNILQGSINTIPTYYGDGTQWVKFKN